MNEKSECKSEQSEPLNIPQDVFIYLHQINNHMAFPQESHVTAILH